MTISLSQKRKPIEETISPYSVTLSLERGVLLLAVEWTQGGKPISYVLRRFYQESESYAFIRDLLKAVAGERVYVPIGTQSAAKLTTRAGLKGVLEEIFIRNRGWNWCALNSKTVYCSVNPSHFRALREVTLNLPLA